MSDLNIGQIVATTLRNRQKELADNVTNHNALWATLDRKGLIKSTSGGRVITEPLIYAENGTAKWYSGYETFTVTDQDVIDAAEYDWKQLGGFVTMSGLEQIQNSGKAAVINLMDAKMKALKATLANDAAAAVYADGTGSGGKTFGGLQLLVADDPTTSTSVGGINQNTHAFWRNQANDLSGGSTVTTSGNIGGYMNDMYLNTCRGTDKVDLIAADAFMFTKFEESLQQYQRFATSKMAEMGFNALAYKGADVVYDDNCPADHMYFLNTDYLCIRTAPNRKFAVGDVRKIDNADYEVIPVFLAGNLTTCNRSLQGVIVGKSS